VRGKVFIIIFSALFILYIIAEINRPKEIDWTVSMRRNDKNPYGGYIIYSQLKHIFPAAAIQTLNTSVFRQVNNSRETNTAYFIISPVLRPTSAATKKMKSYVSNGNYIVASANQFYTPFLDSLGIETTTPVYFRPKDSTSINFVNPAVKAKENYTFLQGTIDQYFSKIDHAKTTILSINNRDNPVFVKIPYGKGAFFIHAGPLCFSNYFLLFRNNASYTAKALSYIPKNISKIYWDEFYKSEQQGSVTPFRFFLSNEYLRWFLRLAVAGMILYILFEMKRRQRVIPVMEPLKNSTLDFVKTVAGVYYNEKNNREIADQKLNYFLEYVRNRFNIATNVVNEEFAELLQRKSGVGTEEASELVKLLALIQTAEEVPDDLLLELDRSIDKFYKQI
jgi:hypothetical protein